jgi:heme/copper-type cytochrome/quinol oxidase subunit 2
MPIMVRAVSREEFQAWIEKVKQIPAQGA